MNAPHGSSLSNPYSRVFFVYVAWKIFGASTQKSNSVTHERAHGRTLAGFVKKDGGHAISLCHA
jgi:hypothetical protein